MSRKPLLAGVAALLLAGLTFRLLSTPSLPAPQPAPPKGAPSSSAPLTWDCPAPTTPVLDAIQSIQAAADPNVGRMGNGNPSAGDVERCIEVLSMRPQRYVAGPQDRAPLLFAMQAARASSDKKLGNPLCYARYLLDLDEVEAKKLVEDSILRGDVAKQRDAVVALTYHVGEDRKKTWALDLLHKVLKERALPHDLLDDVARSLGAAHFTPAAGALQDALAHDPLLGGAASALGELGDKSAAPTLIQAFKSGGDPAVLLGALGHLATPAAVDLLLANIHQDEAVRALGRLHELRALPLLKDELAHLQSGAEAKTHRAYLTVAIARLEDSHPVEAVLTLGEHRDNDLTLRREALISLLDDDITPVQDRVLALFKSDPDTNIRRFCVWLLAKHLTAESALAMLEAALTPRPVESKDDLATESSLLTALNKSLGTAFTSLDDLRACVKEKGRPPALDVAQSSTQ